MPAQQRPPGAGTAPGLAPGPPMVLVPEVLGAQVWTVLPGVPVLLEVKPVKLSRCQALSRASMTGAGTKSPNWGKSFILSRPSRSNNNGLVPYSTAWPGPG